MAFPIDIDRRPYNTLALPCECVITLATEDSSLSVVAENLRASFEALEAVKKFCDSHELKINSDKTQLILFKKPGKPIPDDFHFTLDNSTA